MKIEKVKLKSLKISFDLEVSKSKLSRKSAARYQSWIRRYLKYCRNSGLEISNDSFCSFLKRYESYSTRRQGFYALKFFAIKVIKQKNFIEFGKTVKIKTWNKKRNKSFRKYLFFNQD